MAQLWGGRFTKETDQLVYTLTLRFLLISVFISRISRESIAHVTMLEKQGILTKEEKDQIIEGLESICRDVENKTLGNHRICDIHSFVEANLIDRIGDAGKNYTYGIA